MSKSHIVKCSCTHEYQDKRYGDKLRVATPTTKSKVDSKIDVKCTVCSKIHTVNK